MLWVTGERVKKLETQPSPRLARSNPTLTLAIPDRGPKA